MKIGKLLIPVLIIVFVIFYYLSVFLITRPLKKIANDFNPDSIIEVTNRDDIQIFDIEDVLKKTIDFIIENSISSNDYHTRGELHPFFYIILEDETIIKLKLDTTRERIYINIYDKRGNPRVRRVLYDCIDIIDLFEESVVETSHNT